MIYCVSMYLIFHPNRRFVSRSFKLNSCLVMTVLVCKTTGSAPNHQKVGRCSLSPTIACTGLYVEVRSAPTASLAVTGCPVTLVASRSEDTSDESQHILKYTRQFTSSKQPFPWRCVLLSKASIESDRRACSSFQRNQISLVSWKLK